MSPFEVLGISGFGDGKEEETRDHRNGHWAGIDAPALASEREGKC